MWRYYQLLAVYTAVSVMVGASQMPHRLMAVTFGLGTALALMLSLSILFGIDRDLCKPAKR